MGDIASPVPAEKAAIDVCNHVQDRIREADLWRIPGSGYSGQRTHLVSPEPFPLSAEHIDIINRLGKALLAFYSAVNDLYLRSGNEWVNEYLDKGKGEDLLRQARMKYQKHALPGIIRPDILITDEGLKITELDSVPGGFGHLECLSAAYREAGFDLVGSGIKENFTAMIRGAAAVQDSVCAMVVSDESADYRPEMEYLCRELRESGPRAYAVHPKEVTFTEEGLYIHPDNEPLRVDVLYRFFELFDQLNIPKAELIAYAARKKLVVVTPPYKPYLEEKMLLALIHNKTLEDYWRKSLGEENYSLLLNTITDTFFFDNRPVPPHAEIGGFRWKGEPVRDWRIIKEGTQKERQLVLKPSGFSPLAWGSRGVKVGHDMPQEEWSDAVDTALASFDASPYVLQPFRETSVIGVKYCSDTGGEVKTMQARVRLCPYYFVVGDEAELGGVLATSCPRDKKLIHGMVDAIISPCRLAK